MCLLFFFIKVELKSNLKFGTLISLVSTPLFKLYLIFLTPIEVEIFIFER